MLPMMKMLAFHVLFAAFLLLLNKIPGVQGQKAERASSELDELQSLNVDDEDGILLRSSDFVNEANFEYVGSGEFAEKFAVDRRNLYYDESEAGPDVITRSILNAITGGEQKLPSMKWDLPTKAQLEGARYPQSTRPDLWWTGSDYEDSNQTFDQPPPSSNETIFQADLPWDVDSYYLDVPALLESVEPSRSPPSAEAIARIEPTRSTSEQANVRAATEKSSVTTEWIRQTSHSPSTADNVAMNKAADEDAWKPLYKSETFPVTPESVVSPTSAEFYIQNQTQEVATVRAPTESQRTVVQLPNSDSEDIYHDSDLFFDVAPESLNSHSNSQEVDRVDSVDLMYDGPIVSERKLTNDENLNHTKQATVTSNYSFTTSATTVNTTQESQHQEAPKILDIDSETSVEESAMGKSFHARGELDSNNKCLIFPNFCEVGEVCHWDGHHTVCRKPINVDLCQGQHCLNGGVCYTGDGLSRCDCPIGFYGQHCEVTSPCRPNPCKQNCKCVESCRHELGYLCRSEGGFTGKNCEIPLPRLFCEPNQIRLELSPELIRDFDHRYNNPVVYASPEPISAAPQSPGCYAARMRSNLQIVIPRPFYQCGTSVRDSPDGADGQMFSNRLWADMEGVGFSMPVPIADFECTYKRQYNLITSLKPVLSAPVVVTKTGRYPAELQLCKISSCPLSCPAQYKVEHGAVYTVGELIHLTLLSSSQTLSSSTDLQMSVEELSFSCDRGQATFPLPLIRAGCPVASGMHVRPAAGLKACVSLQTPRAKSCATVYLHVLVRFCAEDEMEVCGTGARRCQRRSIRGRRSLANLVSLSVIGPLEILEVVGRGTINPFPDSEPGRLNQTNVMHSRSYPDAEKSDKGIFKERNVVPFVVAVSVVFCSVTVLLVLGWCCIADKSKKRNLPANAT